MILSLKAGYFVVENTSFLHQSEISSSVDISDFENENEEKKEIDESEKIHQSIIKTSVTSLFNSEKFSFEVLKKYNDLHYEFTTPPPEVFA